jgi:hypothetical protein
MFRVFGLDGLSGENICKLRNPDRAKNVASIARVK